MKAKVKDTGEILDLYPYHSGYWIDLKTQYLYRESNIEFLPDTPEKVIEGWVAADEAYAGGTYLHTEMPYAHSVEFCDTGDYQTVWRSNGDVYEIDYRLFPDLNPYSEPKKYRITITPME